jgi:hypothetical protein
LCGRASMPPTSLSQVPGCGTPGGPTGERSWGLRWIRARDVSGGRTPAAGPGQASGRVRCRAGSPSPARACSSARPAGRRGLPWWPR